MNILIIATMYVILGKLTINIMYDMLNEVFS